jgi:hypothetical protein
MQVYVVGFDPVDNPSGGVGGFDWFYEKDKALEQIVEHTVEYPDEYGYFVWFRKLEVADDMSRDDITEHIEKLIMDFGSDGDWVTTDENWETTDED